MVTITREQVAGKLTERLLDEFDVTWPNGITLDANAVKYALVHLTCLWDVLEVFSPEKFLEVAKDYQKLQLEMVKNLVTINSKDDPAYAEYIENVAAIVLKHFDN